jgi:hypothetical protein
VSARAATAPRVEEPAAGCDQDLEDHCRNSGRPGRAGMRSAAAYALYGFYPVLYADSGDDLREMGVAAHEAATEYVLIDFENVQPKNLEILKKHPFKVFVFCGANQTKVPTDFAEAMQDVGRYVRMSGNGRNALDFHIACYLGELVAMDPQAHFHIISRDKGFDPLIRHLRDRHISVCREEDLAEIPVLRMADTETRDEKIDRIIGNLKDRGQSRPRKRKTLANTINSLFTKKLAEAELNSLIDELKQRGYISVNEGKVSYQFGN